ncbi:MAG: hypothetical protein JNL70_01700 [Saprospiraceae bacterium]|nr:hypothetical protein [Saprospiraceae bacterium]
MKNINKTFFQEFYKALSGNEKKTFGFGVMVFVIGFVLLLDCLRPPSWWGWQETVGELVGTEGIQSGQFSGGSTNFVIQYYSADGQKRLGTFHLSPIILNTMKTIRVFYQKNDPSVFYVHNPTRLVIAVTMTLFGAAVLLTFYLYNRDRLMGITYD